MRILWLSHLVPYPPKGGVLQRSHYLLKELSKQHEVDLLAFNQNDLIKSFYPTVEEGLVDARNQLSQFVKRVEFFDIPSVKSKLGRYLLALKSLFTPAGYTMDWLVSDEFATSLKTILAETDYDLVHFDTISLAIYRHLVKDTPVSLDHHNIESHMMIRRASKEGNYLKKGYFYLEGLKLKHQEKKWCSQFDVNITCSAMDTDRLNEIVGPLNSIDIPNGVDVEYFKPRETAKRNNSLIFIGTMNWYPNIEAAEFLLSEVFPQVKKIEPNCLIDIIGASPPESIKKYHNPEQGIHIHGFVDEIRDLFDSAYLYICPISDGGGTKLKILDAMAMGKAIIAHPIACEGINLKNGESVCFCESKEEFVKAIIDLFSNPEKVKVLGVNARALAEKDFSFEMIGESLVETFEKCIER